MCFAVFGVGLEAAGNRLEGDLQAHLKQSGSDLVSRTAIVNWFLAGGNASRPGRQKAYQFLESYLIEEVDYETLSDEQKKVHNQITQFLRSSISSIQRAEEDRGKKLLVPQPSSLRIQASNISRVIDANIVEKFFETWPGTYISYRRRLILDNDPPMAREVIRLTRIKDQMVYEHWHRRNGVELAKFEGFLHVRGESIWLLGQSEDGLRLRVCHLPSSDVENPKFSKFRWGLMHSDIPLPTSKDPASTRIFMVRQEEKPANLDLWTNELVKYVDGDGELEKSNEWIKRFIENEMSSHSRVNTIEPEDAPDTILRVEKRTVENACGNLDFDISPIVA